MSIYNKPISFTLLAAGTVLIGTIAMVVVPMFMPSTQPHNSLQKVYTPLQLAGRDVYMAEGCNNCHTQTVRPLKAEVARYGDYSKAWEFEYDRPFLWGSKRTGPDLARIGGKYSDEWHYRHYRNPRKVTAGSNMPSYAFLENNELDPAVVEQHIKGIGYPYTAEQIEETKGKTQMDALVAYTQMLGIAVPRPQAAKMIEEGEMNPLKGGAAIGRGEELFTTYCTGCHSIGEGAAEDPDKADLIYLGDSGDMEDWEIFTIIAEGNDSGMPSFGQVMGRDKVWSVVSYLRSMFAKDTN